MHEKLFSSKVRFAVLLCVSQTRHGGGDSKRCERQAPVVAFAVSVRNLRPPPQTSDRHLPVRGLRKHLARKFTKLECLHLRREVSVSIIPRRYVATKVSDSRPVFQHRDELTRLLAGTSLRVRTKTVPLHEAQHRPGLEPRSDWESHDDAASPPGVRVRAAQPPKMMRFCPSAKMLTHPGRRLSPTSYMTGLTSRPHDAPRCACCSHAGARI